jgi:hypothetical protein
VKKNASPGFIFEKLRAETAALLNLNIDELSLVQSLRLDRIVALRVEFDRIQAQQAGGSSIDVDRMTTTVEELEKLLPVDMSTEWDLSRLSDDEVELLGASRRKHAAPQMAIYLRFFASSLSQPTQTTRSISQAMKPQARLRPPKLRTRSPTVRSAKIANNSSPGPPRSSRRIISMSASRLPRHLRSLNPREPPFFRRTCNRFFQAQPRPPRRQTLSDRRNGTCGQANQSHGEAPSPTVPVESGDAIGATFDGNLSRTCEVSKGKLAAPGMGRAPPFFEFERN